jgi:preprotein translocase subunit SecF
MGLINYNIEKYSPKQLVIIPLILLALSLILLSINILATGFPLTPGLEFSGGYSYSISTTQNDDLIRAAFVDYPLVNIKPATDGKLLEFDSMDEVKRASLDSFINKSYPQHQPLSFNEPTFGKSNQSLAVLALIMSFVGMSIVIFISFRTFIPSIAVVLSAFADMVMTAAAMSLLGIPLTLGTTAALLMLIGYSVDSDILLTTRVLKRQGKLHEKLKGAFDTGIIMTSTTLAASAAMFIVSWFYQVEMLWQISAVLLIGLIADILNTWLTNAAILKWYVTKGGGK